MGNREVEHAQAVQERRDDYVRPVAGSAGAADEIEKAKQIFDSGAITRPDFEALKAKAVS